MQKWTLIWFHAQQTDLADSF